MMMAKDHDGLEGGPQKASNGLSSKPPLAPKPTGAQYVPTGGCRQVTAREREGRESAESSGPEREFRLSPQRWPTLIGFCALGFCNGISNEHSSIMNVYTSTLEISLSNYVLLNQVFFFMPAVMSFTSAVLIRRFNSRAFIFTLLALSAVRNVARALLFSRRTPAWPALRYAYWTLQRLFTALTIGAYFCLPLKLSENWFSESERSLALSLCSVVPILGSALGSLTFPRFILDADTAQPLAYVNLGALALAALAVLVGVRRSQPAEGPPSERARVNLEREREARKEPKASNGLEDAAGAGQAATPSLWAELTGRVLKKPDLVLQLALVCTFEASLIVLTTIMQDIMSSAGLSRVFTGNFMAFSAVLAASVQLSVSYLLRPVVTPGKSTEGAGARGNPYNTRTCKLLAAAKCATFVSFAMSLTLQEIFGRESEWLAANQWWLIIASSIAYIVTKFCAMPYFNEQQAELIKGSISEATTSACQSAAGGALYHTLLFIFVRLRQEGERQAEQQVPARADEEEDALPGPLTTLGIDIESPAAESSVVADREPARYLRSTLFVCTCALLVTLLYVSKFDAGARRRGRHERARKNQSADKSPLSAVVVLGGQQMIELTAGTQKTSDDGRRRQGADKQRDDDAE